MIRMISEKLLTFTGQAGVSGLALGLLSVMTDAESIWFRSGTVMVMIAGLAGFMWWLHKMIGNITDRITRAESSITELQKDLEINFTRDREVRREAMRTREELLANLTEIKTQLAVLTSHCPQCRKDEG